MEHIVKILQTEYITHNVKRLKVEKPDNYVFSPGQSTYLAINQPEWKDKKRPFTFTGLNSFNYLEFTIKIYPQFNGVTKKIELLQDGDELILAEPFGSISYKGKGIFIAAGSGITPFMAILRQLYHDQKIKGNILIDVNTTSEDIIYGNELNKMLGTNFFSFLTRENVIGFNEKKLKEDNLKEIVRNFSQFFYVCGPEMFVNDIGILLKKLGAEAEKIVIEK